MVKYLVLIGDGMSDHPLRELGGKTPLEVARTPQLDFLARNGDCGWVNNVPKGMEPGSDVAAMSIFGYDPKKYYSGRGPLEAASLGIKLAGDEVAFRCNLVTVKKGRMESFTAHHIKTPAAKKIIKLLDDKLGSKAVKFYAGLSYRHLLVMKDDRQMLAHLQCTPPHDITGRLIHSYLPGGRGRECLLGLMNGSEVLLHRLKSPATLIWPWGQGKLPSMPSFKKRFGLRGAIITAVHLLKGLGKTLGLEVINVPGATGYLDTNYRGKAEYALRAMQRNDIVFVHVEAPDEAGHEGDARKKIKAIEDFDRLVIGTILARVKGQGSRIKILVLPDHPTPTRLMTHTAEAVPFVIYPSAGVGLTPNVGGYNEKEIRKSNFRLKEGHTLLNRFLK
jgi:2,3-bisphosphoglycerate-independent phosphoglycerate mutase